MFTSGGVPSDCRMTAVPERSTRVIRGCCACADDAINAAVVAAKRVR